MLINFLPVRQYVTPCEITKLAIGDDVKLVAEKLGKNLSWIYRLMDGPAHDPYTKLIMLFLAIDQHGRDIIFRDLQARYEAAKENEALKSLHWDVAIADAVREVGQAISGAVIDSDPAAMHEGIVKGIQSLQNLLTLVRQHANASAEKVEV
jgi:hypothetical protein